MPLAPRTDKYPLVIFSHGLAGTRNTYSQYCASLAAAGSVVLAIEHRDGSGPAILNPGRNGDSKDGELMTYLTVDELRSVILCAADMPEESAECFSEEGGTHPSKDRLRSRQLDMRLREVYETYHSFRRLVSGEDEGRTIVGTKADDGRAKDFLDSLRGRVDVEDAHLTGHSFGGGTMVSNGPKRSFQGTG